MGSRWRARFVSTTGATSEPVRERAPVRFASMPDVVTMDKIVSLARRRGFVFPSSEIYGGLGSAYDYGHYGVLLKENVKARWLEAMVRERDDIVALDSSIILHPRVWEASGHVGGFTDPLVDCRTCKLRFRADHLADPEHEELRCGRKPSKRPGETPDCNLTEPRQFNLMFETRVGRRGGDGLEGVPPSRDRAGHLHQLQERRPAGAPQAPVRHRADRQVVPQRDHARELHLPHARVRADGDGVLRPARGGRGVVPLLDRGAPQLVPAARHPGELPARAPARCRRAVALLERHERHRVPLSDRLVGAGGHRQSRRLRPHARTPRRPGRSSSGSTRRAASGTRRT